MMADADNGLQAHGSDKVRTKVSRRSAPKVRTGCITCKIRHVKCDEARPSCLRCTSTGRTCDGYNHEKKPPKESRTLRLPKIETAVARRPAFASGKSELSAEEHLGMVVKSRMDGRAQLRNHLLDFRGTPVEHRAMQFFFFNTAPSMSGAFENDFWTELLPKLAMTEPAVYHATIAVAALHEQQLLGGDEDEDDDAITEGAQLSLLQYNKAINELQRKMRNGSTDQIVILSTCLLFICLEFMRRSPDKALAHLRSGLMIMMSASKSTSSSLRRSVESLNDEVLSAFSRLSIQTYLMGRPPEVSLYQSFVTLDPDAGSCVPFKSLREARDDLMFIMTQSLESDAIVAKLNPELMPLGDHRPRREMVIRQIHQWTSRLGLSMSQTLQNPSPAEFTAIRLLRIQSIVSIVWNSAMIKKGSEMAFDEHTERLRSVIPLALAVVESQQPDASTSLVRRGTIISDTATGHPSSAETSPSAGIQFNSSVGSFSSEMGLVFSLYFVALKCRCPVTRREALDLLARTRPRRELGWDARILGQIAQHTIDFEEEGGNVTQDMATWPAEERRVQDIISIDSYDHATRTTECKFGYKPNGLDGELVTWTATIHY